MVIVTCVIETNSPFGWLWETQASHSIFGQVVQPNEVTLISLRKIKRSVPWRAHATLFPVYDKNRLGSRLERAYHDFRSWAWYNMNVPYERGQREVLGLEKFKDWREIVSASYCDAK